MLHNPGFNDGQGMDIHIRTKIHRWWSSIEYAAVRIGNETFEVKSGTQDRRYWVNGIEQHRYRASRHLDFSIGGFTGRFRAKSDTVVQYKLYLPEGQHLMIRSVKDMLRVEIEHPLAEYFKDSLGLMGSFSDGILMGRNGTVFAAEDTNSFGQEWQVTSEDPQLFHSVEGPRYPEQCKMPEITLEMSEARRLAQTLSREDAETACAHVRKNDFKNCVFDVMATDDVDAAEGY